MFPFELKRSEMIQWEKPLAAYIKRNYTQDPKAYADDLRALDMIRKDAILCDASLHGIQNLARYMCMCVYTVHTMSHHLVRLCQVL